MDIIDLPGIYSLSPYTPEEVIARDYILKEAPDVIINIVDATNLERNLYLTTQLLEADCPLIVALNMTDQLSKQNASLDDQGFGQALGVPVVPISALHATGMRQLMETALSLADAKRTGRSVLAASPVGTDISKAAAHLAAKSVGHPMLSAVKILEGDLPVGGDAVLDGIRSGLAQRFEDLEATFADLRYQYITKHYSPFLKREMRADEMTHSEKVDAVLTHKILGIPIFFLFMYFIFHVTFGENLFGIEGLPSPGGLLQAGAEQLMTWLSEGVSALLTASGASDWAFGLVVDGMIGGVGAVLSFVPQIMLVFLFLSILEDSGYMARAAFLMDRLLRRFGLTGRSFMPMLMGFGCSVPSILATRTLDSDKDRRLTMILIPYMSCGAKMPIYALFAAALFKEKSDLMVLGIYTVGIVSAVLSGILLTKTVFRDKASPFILELPAYRMPRLRNLLLHLWEKLKGYIIRAGTVILASTIVIWLLANFDLSLRMVEANSAGSILGVLGSAVKTVFVPLGFANGADGWKAVVAILTGLIAKEAVVSTLGVLYGGGNEEAFAGAIAAAFSVPAALAFMVFNLLTVPCMAAVSALVSEMRSARWTWFTVAFWIMVAWLVSFAVFYAAKSFA